MGPLRKSLIFHWRINGRDLDDEIEGKREKERRRMIERDREREVEIVKGEEGGL